MSEFIVHVSCLPYIFFCQVGLRLYCILDKVQYTVKLDITSRPILFDIVVSCYNRKNYPDVLSIDIIGLHTAYLGYITIAVMMNFL